MKRVCLITAACLFSVLAFCGLSHASDGGTGFAPPSVPRIVALAVANRDFFAKSKLDGLDWLYDVERISGNMIGIVLIEPLGVEMTYIFDVASGWGSPLPGLWHPHAILGFVGYGRIWQK
ncbi:hypothetical protein FACS1894216_19500 [Synergistales bacterium]|nr:hypothetical protein FACS1894216_19500 [Synergistales bacterium]